MLDKYSAYSAGPSRRYSLPAPLGPTRTISLSNYRPDSFGADAFISEGKRADHPICRVNAGYSSGRRSVSLDTPLEARELTCTARGDKHCTFIMAHRTKISEKVGRFTELLRTKCPEKITRGAPLRNPVLLLSHHGKERSES